VAGPSTKSPCWARWTDFSAKIQGGSNNEKQQKNKRLNFATPYLPPKFICKARDIRSFASSLELNDNLARQHDLGIKVTNEDGRVDVCVEGTDEQLDACGARREQIERTKGCGTKTLRRESSLERCAAGLLGRNGGAQFLAWKATIRRDNWRTMCTEGRPWILERKEGDYEKEFHRTGQDFQRSVRTFFRGSYIIAGTSHWGMDRWLCGMAGYG
jgi:hypothetical protein